MTLEAHPVEKVDAQCECLDEQLVRMDSKIELALKDLSDRVNTHFKLLPIVAQDDKVVRITDLSSCMEFSLHKLIKFIPVYIRGVCS